MGNENLYLVTHSSSLTNLHPFDWVRPFVQCGLLAASIIFAQRPLL
jgi:hypothetical protein